MQDTVFGRTEWQVAATVFRVGTSVSQHLARPNQDQPR